MKLRKLFIISPIGLLLLAGLVTAWWFLGDDEWVRVKVEETVSELTERSLSIDGAFSIDWSTNPVITAENIHFSNPEWTVNPDLASLERLEMSIDLFSLLSAPRKINYVTLSGLVIAVEEHESGEKSWEILSGQEEPTPVSGEPPTELPVSVDRIALTDFSLLHEAPDRTVPFDFHVKQLELTQNADQQVHFVTDGRFGGENFDAAGNLGPLDEAVAGGKISHDIRLSMGEIVLQSQGSIEQLSTFSGANFDLVFSGPEFEWLLTQLAVPQFSHGDFDFRLDLQTDGERTLLDLDGDLGSLQANATGSLELPMAAGTSKLVADISGDDLGTLLEVVGVSGNPRNPFHLTADISHASGAYQIQTLVLEAGSNNASVSGHMGDWPQLLDTELDLSVSGPDLRSWHGILPVEILPEAEFNLDGRLSRVGSQPVSTDMQLRLGNSLIKLSGSLGVLPSMTGADLVVTANGPVDGTLVQILQLDDIPGKDLSLRAVLERDASFIYLNEVSFEVAGNHLDVSGKLGSWPELDGTELIFSMDGEDLNIWSNILNMEALPAGEFSLRGQVSPSTTGLALDAVRLELASSHLTINGIIGEPPGFAGTALSINAAGSSLAAFQSLPGLKGAPALPFNITGNVGMGDPGLTFDDLKLVLGHNSLHLNGLLGLKDQWDGSQFQSQLIIPNLAALGPLLDVEGLPAKRLSVNGSFQSIADGWAFQLTDGAFAGASFESEGKYIDVNGAGQIEATSHVSAPDLAQLGLVAGIENLPGQPIDIKGFVRYDANRTEVRDIKGTLGDSFFEISAELVNPPTWSGSEVTLSASGADVGQLLVERYFEDAMPFSVGGSISRDEQAIRVNRVKVRLGSLEAEADGIIGNLDDMSDTNLQIAVTAPSLQHIGEIFDYPLPDEPFRLSARFAGSPSEFYAEQLEIELGSSDLAGELSVDLMAKPVVNAVLKSNYLDLAWLKTEDNGEETGKTTAESGESEYVIPDDPIKFQRIDAADSDIDITVAKIDLPLYTYRDIHIHSRVTDGSLYLDTFQMRGMDGDVLSGNLAVKKTKESDITSLLLSLQGEGVQLGFGTVEGQDPETIQKANIVANLDGAGATYRELAQSLNGHIEVAQGPGLTEDAGFGLIFGNFIGEFFNLLNPFAENEKFTKNECGVLVVNIESGLVTVDPVISQTDKLTVVAKGVIDLHTEKLQFTFNTKLRKGVGISASMVLNPFMSITGTLASPTIGLDPAAVAVKGTLAVATVGISLLAKSLSDRYLSSKDPCGDALKKSRESQAESSKKGENNK